MQRGSTHYPTRCATAPSASVAAIVGLDLDELVTIEPSRGFERD
jgi:hypothetical protein